MLNNYQWKLYLAAGGQDIVDFFEQNLSKGGKNYSVEYAYKIRKLHEAYCPSPDICGDNEKQLLECAEKTDNVILSLDDLREAFVKFNKDNNIQTDPSNLLDVFINSMAYFTTLLCFSNPKRYIPYYFQYNFNIFKIITEQFEISLPPLPLKRNYKERFYYYEKICETLSEFRKENNLSPYELYAFLYDFAPNYVGGIKSYIVRDLPNPSSAFFIGSSPKDLFLNYDSDIVTPWQCNPDTKAGDMIAMYLTSPTSAVDSIWRSVSVGFNDPFFWYYRCTYIGQPKQISPVSLDQMRSDPILGKMAIIKKNMQGVNGVELLPSQYNRLLELGKSNALQLDDAFDHNSYGIYVERDVEKQLVNPLILKLGYGEEDYVSQLQIRVGNNNFVLIPDYVLLPIVENGHYTAFGIIEVKYSISSCKMLNDVKIQVRSYAKQLGAEYAVIASKEGLWLTARTDDYEKVIFETNFDKLASDLDVFSQLRKLIGHRK